MSLKKEIHDNTIKDNVTVTSSNFNRNDAMIRILTHFLAKNSSKLPIEDKLGDLKESPSLGESCHVMFSGMAKYSSLTAFYTFSEQQPKATEDNDCLHQS